jgi:hypothetical protein
MVNLVIIKDIIDVAKALFDLRHSLAKAPKNRREQMADYFHTVSLCLAATYEDLASNVVPQGRCGELSSYADSLPYVVEGLIEKSKAEELSYFLKKAPCVESMWEQFNANPEKIKELPVIAEASGIFLALSNSVRAGLRDRD